LLSSCGGEKRDAESLHTAVAHRSQEQPTDLAVQMYLLQQQSHGGRRR